MPQLQGEGFAEDIGTHVQWLAGQKIGHAHIRIAPQELGPVEVRLQLDGGAVVREEALLADRNERIRDVREGPDGILYILTDEDDGKLIELRPAPAPATGISGSAAAR